jgi:hypothetical protein
VTNWKVSPFPIDDLDSPRQRLVVIGDKTAGVMATRALDDAAHAG